MDEGRSLDGGLPKMPPGVFRADTNLPVGARIPVGQEPYPHMLRPATPPPVVEPAPALGAAEDAPRTRRRPAVRVEVRRLSLIMELKLRKNDFKGGWAHIPPVDLLAMLKAEVAELEGAIENGDPLDIAQECADVANFAMMIADVTEGI